MNKHNTIILTPNQFTTKHDLIGGRFGSLVVAKMLGKNAHHLVMWECLCDCGKLTKATTQALLSKTSKAARSCGCGRKLKNVKDITGLRSGKLVAVKITSARDATGRMMWECLCDCGNTRNVVGSEITRGSVKSCGCTMNNRGAEFSRRRKKSHDISQIIRGIYVGCKSEADERGYEFALTFKEFARKILKPCYYCGEPASNTRTKKLKYEPPVTFRYNGLDRVDNIDGYVKGNVVPCCDNCNTAKLQQDPMVFLQKVMRIFKYRTKLEPIKDVETVNIPKRILYSRKGSMVKVAKEKQCELDHSLVAQLPELLKLPCTYCGEVQATGLDRIDSSLGYLMDNVVPCCETCNKMKNDMTLSEFKKWTRRIYDKWKDFEFGKIFDKYQQS